MNKSGLLLKLLTDLIALHLHQADLFTWITVLRPSPKLRLSPFRMTKVLWLNGWTLTEILLVQTTTPSLNLLHLAPTLSEVVDKEVTMWSLKLESLLNTLCGLKNTELIKPILLLAILNAVLPTSSKFKFFAVFLAQAKMIEPTQLFTLLNLALQNVLWPKKTNRRRTLKLLGMHQNKQRLVQQLLWLIKSESCQVPKLKRTLIHTVTS